MALQINYTAPSGVQATTAYARIDRIMGNKDGYQIMGSIFYTAATRDANQAPIGNFFYQANGEITATTNITTSCYDYLKTLPDFAGAVDC